jgi:hypothetical protein
MDIRLLETIGQKTFDLLNEKRALLSDTVAFWVWPRADRVIVVFDPSAIDLARVDERFAHILSTRLYGRRVKRTNSRGLFLQVGYELPLLPEPLVEKPLDLSRQPTPLSVPVGTTGRGELWIPLLEGVSFLVAGSTGMGKTGLIHGWIQALLHGGKCQVYAWDGKDGMEFVRYAGLPNFHLISDLRSTVGELLQEAKGRRERLLTSGAANIADFNRRGVEYIEPIVLLIDEARLVREEVRPMIAEIVERERATGICPVLCTNNPIQGDILVKTNLVTRICFAVPSWTASQMALGTNGAEKLPKTRGRGLLTFGPRVMEFQAFRVMYPEPTQAQVEAFRAAAVSSDVPEDERRNLEAQILELHAQGKSISRIVRELWGVTGGGAYYERSEHVKAILKSTSSSTSAASMAVLGAEGAV